MSSVLKDTYNYFETFKGKRLIYLILGLFFGFLMVGLLVGFLPGLVDNEPSQNVTEEKNPANQPQNEEIEKTGRVVYVDPSNYPDDGISYKLVDEKGNDIILLKTSDDKLKVIEGSKVRLVGKMEKSFDKTKDVLFVSKIIYN
ncbi:hypothetical protein HY419_01760 [candidate division WWE3 bacterium]|nr:hypothetical protein [candidate division WWE3 bacterium]